MIINIGFVAVNAVTVWLAVHLIESNKEKQDLIKEMQKNEKLQVVGQVAASVAHEIRNPMTSVRGFIQMLSGSKNISTDEKNYLHICLDELDRANAIISDYLSLGRSYEMERKRMIDVSELATRSVNTLISYATIQNVNVTLESCNGAYTVGNPSRLQQMLINLIKNAIEAVPSGGNVAVSVSNNNNMVQISVQDDGVGMTASQIENIGLPYYSTKEKGTGLGLMVTLQIIKEMDGAWNVTSTLNKGTEFKITFPLRKEGDGSPL
ncbi:HAMP domain-containing sensor histidine kinase [Bacillus sp. T3]|uniref:HAMP domain-containing sensor histidine kinase n=1 Tax=Bacillus sp. T3 TaxID=467262 RepID=UPI00298285E0|nr:HAMP domain-containing sensor histidine kinase [Bacillus sp. T3]